MRKFCLYVLIVGLIALPVFAADVVTNINPFGAVNGVVAQNVVVPTDGEDPVCGALDFNSVGAMAAARRTDGTLDSWVLAPCEFSGDTVVGGMAWLTIDNTDGDWNGSGDFAIWVGDTVKNLCANDNNTFAGAWDIANTREPLMDDNGNQVVLFGRNAWIYTMKFDRVNLDPGEYYFAPRPVIHGGQSFILTRDCAGDKPIWFQSGTFGFPCALPGNDVFGTDRCAAIAPLEAGPPPEPTCIYRVSKVKAKAGVCGESCDDCSYARGDLLCTVPCDPDAPRCDGKLKGFNDCVGGGSCKVKADNVGCDLPPDGCQSCGV